MTDEAARWDRIQTLFHAAAELPATARREFLAGECAGDQAMADAVLAMLEADGRADSLLDAGVTTAAHRVMRDDSAPRMIGPYRLTRVLGEGGMGVVYLGERDDLRSVAAIKLLRDAWLSPARRERFLTEQRTLAQLDHPAIAKLHDADTLADGTPWFVMEYVDGVPVTEYCTSAGLDVNARLRLLRAICEAVRHAHGRAVIHRDIKPSNILVRADGTVKLLDFGIAKQLETVDGPLDRTRTGLRLMTPGYAAPEQLRGEPVGTYTDVYALGVLLYEVLTGRPPFPVADRAPAQIERAILEDAVEPPSHVQGSGLRGVDRRERADLDVLCLTAMHVDPERRYRSVDALVRDIDHFLAGEPLQARPDALGYRLGKFVRRNRPRLAAAAIVVISGIAFAGFHTVRLANARDAAIAEAARTQRIQAFMRSLFEGGDAEAGPADSLRVVTLLDRGLREARTLDADPAVQSELYATLGDLYLNLGALAAADSVLRLALDGARALATPTGDASPDLADAFIALGRLRAEQAAFDDAEQLVRDGLAMARRTLPPGHPRIARATTTLGRVLEERGRYDDAAALLEEAIGLLSGAGLSTDLVRATTALANTHFYSGRYPVADSLNRQVLELDRQLHGDRHPRIAETLVNIGAVAFEQGRYQDAEQSYREALAINLDWHGTDHPATAANLTMLGRALVYQDRYDEAVRTLERSLEIQERVYGTVHPRVASALNELGNIAIGTGEYDVAEAYFDRMVSIYRTIHGEDHSFLAVGLSNLASVYMARGDLARAELAFRDVVDRFTRSLSAGHTNTAIARIKLGRVLLRQNRFQEAAAETRAGYDILAAQTEPATSFLRAARQDLVTAYDSLGRSADAERFRTELADMPD